MFDKTITLFCNEGNGTYRPHVFERISVNLDKGYLLRTYGADYSDGASVHIPLEIRNGAYYNGTKRYMDKKGYESLTAAAKASAFVCRGGNLFDFVWVGDYRAIDSRLAPIQDGNGFFQAFKKANDNVFAIQSVSGPYSVIPHIEISCK